MISWIFNKFDQDTRGVAATEFVLWLAVLVFPLLNAVDLSFYVFQRMQVETAAQAAVQVAWKQCDYTKVSSPLVANCPSDASGKTVLQNMLTAAQSLSLGNGVTLTSADLKEGYFCSNGSGSLVNPVSGSSVQSSDWKVPGSLGTIGKCSASGLSGKIAGDYVQATVHYTYTPIFPYASIVSLLPTTMTKTAILRLDGGS